MTQFYDDKIYDSKKELLLTDDDMDLISHFACDYQSGNYLIRPRTYEYKQKFSDMMNLLSKTNDKMTDKEKQMVEYFKACNDLSLYKDFCINYGIWN